MNDKESNFWDGRIKRWRKEKVMISDDILKVLDSCGTETLRPICDELLQRREEAQKTCAWKLYRDGSVLTECGHEWYVSSNPLVNFCCFCGRLIEEIN